MITGDEILSRNLIKEHDKSSLKHSTYDLTIGHIIPVGKDAAKSKDKSLSSYWVEPREMVWVLSKEEFDMPANVTGIATLRTTLTKAGILALNIGIVDPMFKGPISTALINFSDRPRRIDLGDKFFRVVFFEHNDVSKFHYRDENTVRAEYIKDIEKSSYADFSKNFLNVPEFNDKFYYDKFYNILFHGIFSQKKVFIPLFIVLFVFVWFLIDLGLMSFFKEKYALIKSVVGL